LKAAFYPAPTTLIPTLQALHASKWHFLGTRVPNDEPMASPILIEDNTVPGLSMLDMDTRPSMIRCTHSRLSHRIRSALVRLAQHTPIRHSNLKRWLILNSTPTVLITNTKSSARDKLLVHLSPHILRILQPPGTPSAHTKAVFATANTATNSSLGAVLASITNPVMAVSTVKSSAL